MTRKATRHYRARQKSMAERTSLAGAPRAIENELTVMTNGQLSSIPNVNTLAKDRQFELYNPDDLLGRKGYAIYREMRIDDTIKACLNFKKVLISGRAWEIEPAGGKEANEEQKAQAQFVEDALKATNFNKVMREQLTALDFGSSFGEINWKVKQWKSDGLRIVPDNIKFRDPEFMNIDVDEHGNVVNFRQRGTSIYANSYISIPPEKMCHYAYQSEFSNHLGISDLRSAYAAWWSKKFVTQFYNIFLERFGQPLMMMKYPGGASTELKSALQSILSNLSTKSDILVPEGVVVELIEASRGGQAGYADALNYFDVRLARAILVPALLGMGDTSSGRGSDSQSRLHLRVLMKVANDVSNDLEFLYSDQLVKPLVDMNFAGVTEFPRFRFRDYGEYEAVVIVDSAINMFNAGMLDADQNDINYLRSILGLELRKEGDEDEIMRPSQQPPVGNPNNPNEQGMGAGKNNSRAQKGPATRQAGGAPTAKQTGNMSSEFEELGQHIYNMVQVPDAPAPVVNVTVPDAEAPQVHVHVPETQAPIINVEMAAPRKVKKTVLRDENGLITQIIEEEI